MFSRTFDHCKGEKQYHDCRLFGFDPFEERNHLVLNGVFVENGGPSRPAGVASIPAANAI